MSEGYRARLSAASPVEASWAEFWRNRGYKSWPARSFVPEDLHREWIEKECTLAHRWWPDFVVETPLGNYVFVDCKATIRTDSPNASIEVAAFNAHGKLILETEIGEVLYAFSDRRIMTYRTLCANKFIPSLRDDRNVFGSKTPFYLVDMKHAVNVDGRGGLWWPEKSIPQPSFRMDP